MNDRELVRRVCAELGDVYGAAGEAAGRHLEEWLSDSLPLAYPESILEHLRQGKRGLVFDAFWQLLPFGTGGRRGPVGYGPNRLNPATVAMTVQGHCDYLTSAQASARDVSVVVANDVRTFSDLSGIYGFLGKRHPLVGTSSRSLAKLACEIYAANGVKAYLADPANDGAVMTTPLLSFAIQQLGAAGGINLSASHNPPDDNGVKVYDDRGSQPIPPDDQRLADRMGSSLLIRRTAFDNAVAEGLVTALPDSVVSDYVSMYIELFGSLWSPDQGIPVVYTPLCGSGSSTVAAVLGQLSFPVLIPPDQGPDGSFEAIPFRAPNPEVPEATVPAQSYAEQHGSTVVLSSDPDADRVGLDIRQPEGGWYHFSGNEIGVILGYYLMLDADGPRRRGLVIETSVTTRMLGEIAKKAGSGWLVDDLLVGFKYIADVLKRLEASGEYGRIQCSATDLVLAAEESHGILVDSRILDKDATPACMYLAVLHQRLVRENSDLLRYYVRIVEEMGAYHCVNRSIMLRGAEGIAERDLIMETLRQSPPAQLGQMDVLQSIDHWDESSFGHFVSDTDKMSRNVIEYVTSRFRVIVRPSGTEPKLKFYCERFPSPRDSGLTGMALLAAARQDATEVALSVYNELLRRIGKQLGRRALMLPDIVDLGMKIRFDTVTLPQLGDALQTGSFETLDQVLEWLQQETAPMAPGADPLPAIKSTIRETCESLRSSAREWSKVTMELAEWART